MVYSSKKQELYKFLKDRKLVSATESEFSKLFDTIEYQDQIFNELKSGGFYAGSKGQFLDEFSTISRSDLESLSANEIFTEKDGKKSTVTSQVENFAESMDPGVKLNSYIRELANSPQFDDKSRQRVQGAGVRTATPSDPSKFRGFEIYDRNNGEVISKFDYSLTSYGERQNALQSAMGDLLTWAQSKGPSDIEPQGPGLDYRKLYGTLPEQAEQRSAQVLAFQAQQGFITREGQLTNMPLDQGQTIEGRMRPDLDPANLATQDPEEAMTGTFPRDATAKASAFGQNQVGYVYANGLYNSGNYSLDNALNEYEGKKIIDSKGRERVVKSAKKQETESGAMEIVLEYEEGGSDKVFQEEGIEKIALGNLYDISKIRDDFDPSLEQTIMDDPDRLYGEGSVGNLDAFRSNNPEYVFNDFKVKVDALMSLNDMGDEELVSQATEYANNILKNIPIDATTESYVGEIYDASLGKTIKKQFSGRDEYFTYLVNRYLQEANPRYGQISELSTLRDNVFNAGEGNPYMHGYTFKLNNSDYTIAEVLKHTSKSGEYNITLAGKPVGDATGIFQGVESYDLYDRNLWERFRDNVTLKDETALVEEMERMDEVQGEIKKYYDYYQDAFTAAYLAGEVDLARDFYRTLKHLERNSVGIVDSETMEFFKELEYVQDWKEDDFESKPLVLQAIGNIKNTLGASAYKSVVGVIGLAGYAMNWSDENKFADDIIEWSGKMHKAGNLRTDNLTSDYFSSPVYGSSLEYEGYKVYVDEEGRPINIYTSELGHVSEAEKRKVLDQISKDESFEEREVKSREWYNPSLAGTVGGLTRLSSDLAVLAAGGGIGSGLSRGALKALPKAAQYSTQVINTAMPKVIGTSIIAGQQYNDLRQYALQAGFSEDEANNYAGRVGLAIGFTNMAFGGLEKGLVGGGYRSMTPTVQAAAAKLAPEQVMKNVVKGQTARFIKAGVIEGAKETFEEVVLENLIQSGYHGYAAARSDNKIEEHTRTADEIYETVLLSFITGFAGGGRSVTGEISNLKNAQQFELDELLFPAAKNINASKKAVERLVADGVITNKVGVELNKNLEYARRAYENMSPRVKDKESINLIYSNEMASQRLEAQAARERNPKRKKRIENKVEKLQTINSTITGLQEVYDTGDSAYVLNGELVSKDEILSFFDNNNPKTFKRTQYQVINDPNVASEIRDITSESLGSPLAQSDIMSSLKSEYDMSRIKKEKSQSQQKIDDIKAEIDDADGVSRSMQNARQKDGSYLFSVKPPEGLESEVVKTEAGETYKVTKEDGDAFITKLNQFKVEKGAEASAEIEESKARQITANSLMAKTKLTKQDLSEIKEGYDNILASLNAELSELQSGKKQKDGSYFFKKRPKIGRVTPSRNIFNYTTGYTMSESDFETTVENRKRGIENFSKGSEEAIISFSKEFDSRSSLAYSQVGALIGAGKKQQALEVYSDYVLSEGDYNAFSESRINQEFEEEILNTGNLKVTLESKKAPAELTEKIKEFREAEKLRYSAIAYDKKIFEPGPSTRKALKGAKSEFANKDGIAVSNVKPPQELGYTYATVKLPFMSRPTDITFKGGFSVNQTKELYVFEDFDKYNSQFTENKNTFEALTKFSDARRNILERADVATEQEEAVTEEVAPVTEEAVTEEAVTEEAVTEEAVTPVPVAEDQKQPPKKVVARKIEEKPRVDEFKEKLEQPFAEGAEVTIKTDTDLDRTRGVETTTFVQTILDEKGRPKTQNYKTYNSLEQLAENLDADMDAEANKPAVEQYADAKNKEIQLVEVRENKFEKSPNFGQRFATIIIDGKRVEVQLEEGFAGRRATDVNSLTAINKDIFGLSNKKAKAAAVISDRMVEAMAKRDGISKDEMYKKISFRRSPGGIPKTMNPASLLFQSDYSARDSKITFTFFKNSKEFDDAVKAGLIQKDVSIESLDGKTAVFHQPDDASVSNFIYKGETILKGRGGALYPVMFKQDVGEKQSVWASTGEAAASGLVNLINESGASNEDGVARLVLTTGSRTKNLSNSNSMEGVASIFRAFSDNPDFGISENTYKKSVVAAMKKAVIENSLTTKSSLDEIITTIQVVSRPENTNFQQRKTFNEQLITEILSRSNNNANSKFVKSMKSFFADTGYKLSVSNRRNLALKKGDEGGLVNGFAYLLGEPIVRDLTSNGSGQAYAVIEVTRPEGLAPDAPLVEAVADDAHGSYPFAIKTINPQSKVSVKFFDKTSPRENIVENPNKQGERFSDALSNLEQGRPRKSAHGKVFPGQAGVSSSILKMMTKSPVAQETEKEIVKADIEESTNRMESQDGATSTVLDEAKEMSVLPLPERFLLGYEEATGKSVSEKDKQSFLYKLGRKFKYQPGGVFVDMKQFKAVNNFTGTSARISVDPETGKPSLSVSDNVSETDVTKGKGKIIRVNLFKKSAGWKWTANFDGNTYENLDKIVSVKVGSKHIYTLNFDGAVPVTLKSYPKEPSEPRLKPTTRGSVHLGPIIGEITRNNITNPVYSTVTVFDPNDKATIDRLIERAQSRSNSAILPTQENYDSHQLKDVPESFVKFQENKGAVFSKHGRHIIFALENPDVSTPLHEMAHVYENYLTNAEKKVVMDFAGEKQWNRSVSEKFARGFEKYLAEGKAPSINLKKIFESFKTWLTDIYNGITGSAIDIELNDGMRTIYANMLGAEVVSKKKPAPTKAKKAEPTVEVAEVKKAEPKVEVAEAPVSTEKLDSFKAEVKKVLASDKTLTAKKNALKTMVNRQAKGLNLVGKEGRFVDRLGKARSEMSMTNAINDFIKIAEKQSKVPGRMIVVNEAKELMKRIKEIDLATRRAEMSVKKRSVAMLRDIEAFLKENKISKENKVNAQILRRLKYVIGKKNPNTIARFEAYLNNIVQDAAYAEKFKNADGLRKKIKGKRNRDAVPGDIKAIANDFVSLNIESVPSIDEYIELGAIISAGMENSKMIKGEPRMPKTFNKSEVNAYVSKELARQRDKQAEELKQKLVDEGLDPKGLTMSQMKAALRGDQTTTKETTKELINNFNALFERLTPDVEAEIKNRGLGKQDAKLVKDFVAMDLNLLKDRAMVIKAANVLTNFLENGSLYGMSESVSYHTGRKNLLQDIEDGLKGAKRSKYNIIGKFDDRTARTFYSTLISVMGGTNNANTFFNNSGTSGLVTGSNSGEKTVNEYLNDFADLRDGSIRKAVFSLKLSKLPSLKKRKNNTYDQHVERAMYAHLDRIEEGSSKEEAFANNKRILKESVEVLTKIDSKKGEAQQKVYDRIVKGSETIEDVVTKMNPDSLGLVSYWRDLYSKHFPELKRVTEQYYNKRLPNDQNYFPRSFITIDPTEFAEEAAQSYGAQRQARITLDTQKIKSLPKGKILNLDFDRVAYTRLREGLIDARTVESLKQIDGYVNSPEFVQIVNTKEEVDRVRSRIDNYRRLKRNELGQPLDTDVESNKAVKRLFRTITTVGMAKVMVQVSQSMKQYLTAMISATSQVGVSNILTKDIISVFNPYSEANKFIDRTGLSIINRGYGSRVEVGMEEKLSRSLSASQNLAFSGLDMIDSISTGALQLSVGFFDKMAARTAFLGFYKKKLKQMGLPHRNIDWASHKLNEEAASFADIKVADTQNVSDEDMKGALFTSRNTTARVLRKIFLPLSGFRLNARVRVNTSVKILASPSTTIEDRRDAAANLVGTFNEMVSYVAIGYMMGRYLFAKAGDKLGFEDPNKCDEKVGALGFVICKKDLDYIIGMYGGRFLNDLLNPFPPGDEQAIVLYNKALNSLSEKDEVNQEDLFRTFDTRGYNQIFGIGGVVFEDIEGILEYRRLANTGEYIYEDEFGNKTVKKISPESQAVLQEYMIFNYFSPVREVRRYINNLVTHTKRMGEDNFYTDAFFEQTYGYVMEKHNLTVDQIKQYVVYEFDKFGNRKDGLNPEYELTENALANLKRNNPKEYQIYQDIQAAIEEAEKEYKFTKTMYKALDEYTTRQLYTIMMNDEEKFKEIQSKYGITKTQVTEEMQKLVLAEEAN